MAFVDYYKILGVKKDIPQKDVRAAYRKRAKQFHPDLHPNDAKAKAKFQALSEAYEVIGDPDKRAKYDKYGEQWRNAEATKTLVAADKVATTHRSRALTSEVWEADSVVSSKTCLGVALVAAIAVKAITQTPLHKRKRRKSTSTCTRLCSVARWLYNFQKAKR